MIEPDPYIIVLTAAGFLIAFVAWLPLVLSRLPLSVPIIFIGLGWLLFALPFTAVPPLPTEFPEITERVTEFVVIIALMGAGLKIDRVFNVRHWSVTFLLIGVTMPISILLMTAFGRWWLGLPLATALLLASALAPTDPVLAADVQVGPPRTGEEDEVRFSLTSEAGLNDGFAFPFVFLAIALSTVANEPGWNWLGEWFSFRVLWEIGVGVLGGWAVGRAFGWVTFHMPVSSRLERTGDGFIALAATFVSYGLTEILQSYGFLAVFVTALAFRHSHREHGFHAEMHAFIEQVERVTMMGLLLIFGGALAGGILGGVGWYELVFAGVLVLAIRPLAGMIGLARSSLAMRDKWLISFFGIRGVGTFYYLAYGLNHGNFVDGGRLWAIVSLIVLFSVLLHGMTVTPLMRAFDRWRGVDPDEPSLPPPGLKGKQDSD
ncbi:MAG: cation:proton antiporter [Methylobacterium mesophilicum]|nr:cation:proton antiporter [Methylobacterium mesophilicum]